MGQRRMFSNRIANSARFLQMPSESQLAYFHMILRADDDGVVEAYPVLKMLGIQPDAFSVLIAKGFVRPLNEDQVVVITDWREHNIIRSDRKVNSIYYGLLQDKCQDLALLEPKARCDVNDNSRRLNAGLSTGGISKDKLSQVNTISDTPSAVAGSEVKNDLAEREASSKRPPSAHWELALFYIRLVSELDTEPKPQQVKRHLRAAKDVLAASDGDLEQSKIAVALAKKYFDGKKLDWTLETLLKHWGKIAGE